MKFETLKRYDIRNLIIILLVIIVLLTTILFLVTRAKYKLVESIPLASGTINYTLVDFELAGMKFKASGTNDYVDVSTIEDNYVLNENESYCTEKYSDDSDSFRDVRSSTIKLAYDTENKTISVKPYSKKGTKCYLFFDEKELPSLNDAIMAQTTGEDGTFTGPSCSNCTVKENGVYEAEDDYGTSYVYRGNVNNNWVKFGKAISGTETGDIWWRIIRINGNGSIRLIYSGTYVTGVVPPENGKDIKMLIAPTTSAGDSSYPRAITFNTPANDNKYVGYMYNANPTYSTSHDDAHKVTSGSVKSAVLAQLELWYNQTDLETFKNDYFDLDVGFCSDTQVNDTSETWDRSDTKRGYGRNWTAYGGYGRTKLNSSWRSEEQYPTLKCGVDPKTKEVDANAQRRDLYTLVTAQPVKIGNGQVSGNNALSIPVGLITMDEVLYAGGFGNQANNEYWLNVGYRYWTISPALATGTSVFVVYDDGTLNTENTTITRYGARPVINIKADVKISGTGIIDDPYVVQTSN